MEGSYIAGTTVVKMKHTNTDFAKTLLDKLSFRLFLLVYHNKVLKVVQIHISTNNYFSIESWLHIISNMWVYITSWKRCYFAMISIALYMYL